MTDRTCSNCACYFEQIINPTAPAQGMCRRNGPVPAQIRTETPRLNAITKEVMLSKVDRKPITDITTENVFLYAPTGPAKVCFDGWRPIGTEPGDNAQTAYIKRALNMAFGKFGVGNLESESLCSKSVSGIHELIKDDSQGAVYCKACGLGKLYVCPQCGPAPEGEEEHARRAHTAEGLFEQPLSPHASRD